jgi:hypothetical protein
VSIGNPEHQDLNADFAGNTARQLQRRIITVFHLPETASVNAVELESPGDKSCIAGTKITIRIGENHFHEHIIAKPLAAITDEDIKSLRAELHAKPTFLGQLLRFFGWWLGFSGLYAMFAVCPFCGQQGCPVGAGSAGIVGGFFALVMQNGRSFLKLITHKFSGAD